MEVHLHSQRMQPLLAKGNNPMVGAPKRQGCPTTLGYRSGYRRCIEQVICKRVSENLFSHATSAAITRQGVAEGSVIS